MNTRMVWMGPIWTPTNTIKCNYVVAKTQYTIKNWSCGLFGGIFTFRFFIPRKFFSLSSHYFSSNNGTGTRKHGKEIEGRTEKEKGEIFPIFQISASSNSRKVPIFSPFLVISRVLSPFFSVSIGFGWIWADSVISVRYGAWISVTSWMESVIDQELGFSLYDCRGYGIWLGLGLGFRQIWGFWGENLRLGFWHILLMLLESFKGFWLGHVWVSIWKDRQLGFFPA